MNKKLAKILRSWADHLDPQERIVLEPGASYSFLLHGGGGGGSGQPGKQGSVAHIHGQKAERAGKKSNEDDSGNKRD